MQVVQEYSRPRSREVGQESFQAIAMCLEGRGIADGHPGPRLDHRAGSSRRSAREPSPPIVVVSSDRGHPLGMGVGHGVVSAHLNPGPERHPRLLDVTSDRPPAPSRRFVERHDNCGHPVGFPLREKHRCHPIRADEHATHLGLRLFRSTCDPKGNQHQRGTSHDHGSSPKHRRSHVKTCQKVRPAMRRLKQCVVGERCRSRVRILDTTLDRPKIHFNVLQARKAGGPIRFAKRRYLW